MSCQLQSNTDRIATQCAINYKELTRDDIQEIIQMRPINIIHYKQAFVHKSIQKFIKNTKNPPEYLKQSYERYEYLGDSVLNLVVANFLFNKYGNDTEGLLTRLRTKLVNGKTLSVFARSLNLGKYIIMSSNVENIGGRTNNRLLEDVFEALVCAIYLDLGFNYAEKFILDCIEKNINFNELENDNNYKDILLRFCQNKLQDTPTYSTTNTEGPPHNRLFTVTCYIKNTKYKEGIGKCKKIAEQSAAKNTLEYFGFKFDPE